MQNMRRLHVLPVDTTFLWTMIRRPKGVSVLLNLLCSEVQVWWGNALAESDTSAYHALVFMSIGPAHGPLFSSKVLKTNLQGSPQARKNVRGSCRYFCFRSERPSL